ncbi:MAG: 4-(cytidine 5'-diphospho)-2-C-methyl-D-erythritol kinase [Deferrisomatales bacterium]
MERPDRLQLAAPAKLNLHLEVRGKRPDGYHDLRMLMVPVSWWDEITLERLAEPGRVELRCSGEPGVEAGADNLCVRAARYYFEQAGVAGGVRIALRKRIPTGAGLGGGSSDAAAVILGLERLYQEPLGEGARREAAFRVGADVPFFFARCAAWVEGIGERVRPCRLAEPLWFVVVCPGVFLSTARVFSRFTMGLTTSDRVHTIAQFNFQGVVRGLRNDLQPAAQALEPRVAEALDAVAAVGAPGRLMTGSGSAVFGLFAGEADARRAALRLRSLREARRWQVEAVRTVAPGAFPFWESTSHRGVDKR